MPHSLSDCADYTYINKVIPEFNRNFLDANSYGIYWWYLHDTESRIKAFDKLIAIYEKKDSI